MAQIGNFAPLIFPEMLTFDIGFVNPELPCNGYGVANDETELSAENLSELEEIYEDFCLENGIPADTVTYCTIVGG